MDTVRKWLLHFFEQPLIRLPITVVVLSAAKDKGYLTSRVIPALEASTTFWRDLGIMLQPIVRGWDVVPNPLVGLGDNIHDLHLWSIGTPTPTIYVFADALHVEGGNLGLAWEHNGIAVVAGKGEGDINLDERIDHELGHLLGLKHEDRTFMRAALEIHDRVVTAVQRTVLLRNAYALGGF